MNTFLLALIFGPDAREIYNSPGIYARACGGAESNPRLWKWGVMACDVIVEKVEGRENRALHETDINGCYQRRNAKRQNAFGGGSIT